MTDLLTATQTLTVDRAEMLEGLAAVAGAIPTRTPKPILMNVLVDATPDRCTLLATDQEVGIRYSLAGVGAESPARLVLPTERVRSILADAEGDASVRIVLDGEPGGPPEHATIRGARFKHRMPLENADLFPDVPAFDDTLASYVVVQARDMRRAIRRTIFATDSESRRYALAGCLFEFHGDHLFVVATDGRRLSRQRVPLEVAGDGYVSPPATPTTVVPIKALRLIHRVTSDEDYPIHVAPAPPEAQGIMFRTERSTIHTRLVEGRYPDYRMILPTSHRTHVSMRVGPFLDAVNQAGHSTSVESRSVGFAVSGNVMKLEASAADVGSGEADFEVVTDGPDVAVAMDSRYMADVLKVLDPEMPIRMGMHDNKIAVVITTEDDFQHAIQPLTQE